MQDRFKFRGLNKGKWYYGAYFKHLPYTPYCCDGKQPEKDYKHLIIQEGFSDCGLPRDISCIEVEKDTIGQCTGLKDKNGKLIYEGDIVKIKGKIFFIRFEIGSFLIIRNGQSLDCWYEMFTECWNDDVYPLSQLWIDKYIEEDFIECLEVIGNIYENPGLLLEEQC